MGWELYPEAIYHVLTDVCERYNLPIIITENGLADAEDTRRGWFICETLKWVHKAIKNGVQVFGYLHWSTVARPKTARRHTDIGSPDRNQDGGSTIW